MAIMLHVKGTSLRILCVKWTHQFCRFCHQYKHLYGKMTPFSQVFMKFPQLYFLIKVMEDLINKNVTSW